MCFFFFFQAEDGIRDLTVTGVQTCALPISTAATRTATSKRTKSKYGSCSENESGSYCRGRPDRRRAAAGRLLDRTVGEAVRTRAAGRSDHEVLARSARRQAQRACVRRAGGGSRRNGRSGGRLWL